MSGRLVIRNRSQYPTDEVRTLVKFAVAEIDMRGVCVNVKNSSRDFSGMAYEGVPYVSNAPATSDYLVTVKIGAPEKFPIRDAYYAKGRRENPGRFPVYDVRDWREALIVVAAHEARHIEQFKDARPRSEVQCEHFAEYVLRSYRAEMPL